VIPTFELDENQPYPSDKKAVLEYWKNNLSRPFHELIWEPAQKATNYKR
jgi:hypothetical protein